MPAPVLAFLDGIGGFELLLILFLVLMLFGGERLPDFARSLGKSIREFKKASANVEQEIRRAIDTAPVRTPPPSTLPPSPVAPPAAPTPAAQTPPNPAPPPADAS